MSTIIVATDFSKVAENAVRYAASLIQQIGGKVVLFHLYTPSIHVSNARLSPRAFDESSQRTRQRLDAAAAELSGTYGIHVVPHLSVLGEFKQEVQTVFDAHRADFLVMGMAVKSLEQDLLGNTTTAVIHQYAFPVLAVPLGAEFQGVDRILFACDNLQGIHRRILDEVRKLAKGLKASVELFHVNNRIQAIKDGDIDEATVAKFGEGLDGITYYYKDVASNTVIKAIADEIREIGAGLLIMLPNRYGFWGSLIHRSKTRVMASGLSVPLLSIPLSPEVNP